MIKELLIFTLQVFSIAALYFIVDYKRPYDNSLINWSTKEKLITFIVAVIALSILKIK